jgi:peptidoglycan-associated lipoprotein
MEERSQMKAVFRIILVLSSALVLANCASRTGTSTESAETGTGAQGAQTSGIQGAYGGYDGRSTGAYGYAQGAQGGMGGPGPAGIQRVVYFDFDQAEIRPDARPVIEANARYLAANPGVSAVLEGNTDERGTREYNIGLGERRAEAVRNSMLALGVSAQQMRTVSYGEERPAVAGQDESSYGLNRRVEITY